MSKVAVVHPPPVKPPPPEYHVVMTEREAQIVCALLGRCVSTGTYELFSQLDDALQANGIKARSYDDVFESRDSGSFRLKEEA